MFNQSNVGKADENSGYSLIEVLVALSLLALLLLFSAQGYQHIKATIESRIVLSRLATLIYYARSEAIRMGCKVIICKSRDAHSCSGNWSDGQIVLINEQKPHVLLAFGAVKQGRLSFRAFQSSDFLHFMPNGTTFEQNGSFMYYIDKTAKPTWTLIVEKSGRIRVVN